MAGAGKAAVLATLMFALLLSASMVNASRPVIEQGSAVATDGRILQRPQGRQLRWFFGCWWFGCYRPWYGWGGFHGGFNGFNGNGGGFNNGGDVRIRNDKHRRLNTFWGGWGWGWGHRWGGWGWGGHNWGYWGRK